MVKLSVPAELSLCWGSMEGAGLRALAELAGEAGFDAITLNPPMYMDARAEGLSDQDIRAVLGDSGVRVSGVDPLFDWLPGAPRLEGEDPMTRLTHATADDAFHIAHVTGTDIINAPLGFTTPNSEQEIVDSFGRLCDRAAQDGLRITLEFMPFTAVPSLCAAWRIVSAANCANGGIMFDCWHHHRSGGSPDDVLSVPGDRVFALQLDDAMPAPMENVVEETLNHRLLPGEGCIDLGRTLSNFAASNARFIYDVEVFNASLREKPHAERARLLYESASDVLAAL